MNIVISGYGRMGHMVEQELLRRGIKPVLTSEDIARDLQRINAKDCVCIDFTTPEAFRANYSVIARSFGAAVIGTTGWDDIADKVKQAFLDNGTTMVYASNFSIGVNAMFAAAARASAILKGAGYTPRIEEIHHIHKLDAPSGTAKTLAAIVAGSLGTEPEISSVREGEVPGIHTLTLESSTDVITLRHEAFSREGFAKGAVAAALLTEGLEGVHEFSSLL